MLMKSTSGVVQITKGVSMGTILVIEDSDFTRRGLVKLLEDAGHKVLQTDSGSQGVKMIEEHHPDCVSLDLLMPKMDGVEVLTQLKQKGIVVPIVVLSADIQDTTKEKCFKLGIVQFVNKPPQRKIYLQAITDAIALQGGVSCGCKQ